MIGTIRKHSTVLWIIIIVVVVIAFVFWGAQSPKGPSNAGQFGTINGETVSKQAFVNARKEVALRYLMSTGRMPGPDAERQGFDMTRETYFRLLMLQHLRNEGIHAGAEAKSKAATDILNSLGRQGQTPTLQDFTQSVLDPHGFTLEDFDRYLGNEIGIRQLVTQHGMAGQLITPDQARALYIRENQEVSVQAAFFSSSNYLDQVKVTEPALLQAYTNQQAMLRTPEKVQVRYVAFQATNFLTEAEAELAKNTNLTAQIEAEYEQGGTNAFPDLTPEEAKEQIRDRYLQQAGLLVARRKAAEFAIEVMEKEPLKMENFEAAAAARQMEIKVTEPFTRDNPPEDIGLPYSAGTEAFRLQEGNPFSRPILGQDAVFVLAYEKRIPSEIPPYEEVKDRVQQQYIQRQAVIAARTAGNKFMAALTNGLSEGKSFAAICTAEGVKPEMIPGISLSTRSLPQVEAQTSLSQFKRTALSTEPKTASRFVPTANGGYVVYVDEQLPIDEARLKEELPDYLDYVRQALRREAFNTWFQAEAQEALVNTPIAQREAPEPGAGAAQ